MSTKMIAILIITVLIIGMISYLMYITKHSPSIIGNEYDIKIKQSQQMIKSETTNNTETGITLESAKEMVKLWIIESRANEHDIIGSIDIDFPQGLPILIKGAIFRYDPAQHRLLVSGLVRYDVKTLGKYPDKWQFFLRTGQREHNTMMYGEAQFELLRQPLFNYKPDVVLLTKVYTERLTDGKKLGVQITWLLLDANYWFVNRYNEIMGKTEEELIKEAPERNEWMLKNRPKPW